MAKIDFIIAPVHPVEFKQKFPYISTYKMSQLSGIPKRTLDAYLNGKRTPKPSVCNLFGLLSERITTL